MSVRDAQGDYLSVVAFIPARGGSKRIPRKNLAEVNGRTLVGRAIAAATGALTPDRIVLSSDDEEILAVGRAAEIETYERAPELASDESTMAEVLRAFLDMSTTPDLLVILEPPATFRLATHIDTAAQFAAVHPEASAVRTVTRMAEPARYYHLHRVVDGGYLDPLCPEAYRAAGVPLYKDNGIANVIRAKRFLMSGLLFDDRVKALEIGDARRGLDIDTPADLEEARRIAVDLDRI